MLVEVNLLQKREQKNRTYPILLSFLLILLIAAFASAYLLTMWINNEIDETQQQLDSVRHEVEVISAKMDTSGIGELEELANTVSTLQAYTVDSDGLLTRLTALLPRTSYFESFQFGGDQISLTINHADEVDAAYYLRHLSDQDWIVSAKLLTVTTIAPKGEADTGDAEGNDGQANQSQATTYSAQYELTIDKDILSQLEEGDDE